MVVTSSSLSPFVRLWRAWRRLVDHLSKLNSLNTGVNASFQKRGNALARHIEQRSRHVKAKLTERIEALSACI